MHKSNERRKNRNTKTWSIKRILTRLQRKLPVKEEPVTYRETPLERIKRIQMGISLEDAELSRERGRGTTLEKIGRQRAEKKKTVPGPQIDFIDTSKLKDQDLITYKTKTKGEAI